MSIPVKTYIKCLFIALSLCLCLACNTQSAAQEEGHSEGDGHDHGHDHAAEEAGHGGNIAEISPEQFKTVGITYTQMSARDLENKLQFNGSLIIPNEKKATINSVYAGTISKLYIKQGDFVKQGQTIASISNPEYIQVQENYSSVMSQIDFAVKEVERQKILNQGQAGSLRNLQNAESQLKSLRAQQQSLRKQLQLMGISTAQVIQGNLINSIAVRSPLSGYITQLNSSIGNFVDPSVSIATVEDNNNILLQINMFEKELPIVKVGQEIEFTLANNSAESYQAKIIMINKSLDANRTIPVHAQILSSKQHLAEGMQAVAYIHAGSSLQQSLPVEAIVNEEGKDYIFVDRGFDKTEGVYKFEKIEVHRGITDANYAAVTSTKTLNSDDKIVSTGAFFVNAVLSGSEGHEH